MDEKNPQVCAGGDTLIFACSGAADVGQISDRAARKLTQDGKGKMFCLAGIGGHVPPILDKTKAASRVLAIDGCSLDCTRKTLEHAGIHEVTHVRVTDLGMEKGKTPATEPNVETVARAGISLLD